MRQTLTSLAIQRLPFTPKGNTKVFDASTPGFGIRITANSKSFFVMMGKERRLKTLGKFPELSLADARKEAKRLLSDNPDRLRLERHNETMTAYLAECEKKNAAKTVGEYRRYLSLIGDKPLSAISKADIDTNSPHLVMAWRVYFNWCIRNELVEKNPFLFTPVRYGKRERTLTENELSSIWNYDRPPFSTILKLLVLTGQRRQQIANLRPEWIADDLVTFPADQMKSRKQHQIPLGDTALSIAQNAPFSFSGWSKSKQRIDRLTGVSDWTIHDLRRTYATIHAKIGTPIHVVEALLDHSSGTISGVAAIYIRHDFMKEMREATLKYEDHISKFVGN